MELIVRGLDATQTRRILTLVLMLVVFEGGLTAKRNVLTEARPMVTFYVDFWRLRPFFCFLRLDFLFFFVLGESSRVGVI